MGRKKYYLDDLGLIRALQRVSRIINNKTSSRIVVNNVENLNTGEVTKELQNPDNFATTKAVYDYVEDAKESRKKLTIIKQTAVVDSEGYNVQNNVSEYNGNESAEIRLNLVDNTDIRRLFI